MLAPSAVAGTAAGAFTAPEWRMSGVIGVAIAATAVGMAGTADIGAMAIGVGTVAMRMAIVGTATAQRRWGRTARATTGAADPTHTTIDMRAFAAAPAATGIMARAAC